MKPYSKKNVAAAKICLKKIQIEKLKLEESNYVMLNQFKRILDKLFRVLCMW